MYFKTPEQISQTIGVEMFQMLDHEMSSRLTATWDNPKKQHGGQEEQLLEELTWMLKRLENMTMAAKDVRNTIGDDGNEGGDELTFHRRGREPWLAWSGSWWEPGLSPPHWLPGNQGGDQDGLHGSDHDGLRQEIGIKTWYLLDGHKEAPEPQAPSQAPKKVEQ